MKQTTIFYLLGCLTLSSNLSFGMLTKVKIPAKKYMYNAYTTENKQTKLIQQILKNNQLDLSSEKGTTYLEHERICKYETRSLYTRNKVIIDMLEEQKQAIDQNILSLRIQQWLAVQDISNNEKEIKNLEQELHKSFNGKEPE